MNIAHDSTADPANVDPKQVSASQPLSRLAALARKQDLLIALGLLLLCFITRIIAIPASLWEWDDFLFARALHKYDLIAHSPHPPGFPVFVVMARLAYWALKDEHRALTTVAFTFASLLAPALFFFYREVFQDRRIAFAGALLGSFAPNVWIHSGAGRSDEVALTLGVIGLTLVIHGMQSRRSLIAGCALFGLAMGVRVTILPVMAPVIAMVFLARLSRREWRLVAAALAAGTICVLVWYVPLIYHVTWKVYRWVMNIHSQFAYETDSIFSNTENAVLSYRFRRFFVEIWGARWIMTSIYAFSALGLMALAFKRQWRAIGWMALSSVPFIIFLSILNTPLSAPLYSLPYIPFFTGLAACGIVKLPELVPSVGRWRIPANAGVFLAIGLTIGMAEWTYPVIKLIHREKSPPIRAIDYLKTKLDPQHDVLDHTGLFSPHASFYLPDVARLKLEKVENPEANLINPVMVEGRVMALTEAPVMGASAEAFHWRSNQRGNRRLRKLSLGRYFDAYVMDLTAIRRTHLLSGWYPEELVEDRIFRWMGPEAKAALFNAADSMTLRLQGSAPANARPTIALRLNGAVIDRFTLDDNSFDHSVTVKTDPRVFWYTLTIEIDQTVNPSKIGVSGDTRDLGIRFGSLEWSPAPGAKFNSFNADQFLSSGWFGLEGDKAIYWRWTEPRAAAYLPAVEGDAQLELTLQAPAQDDGSLANVTIEVAGQVIEKFQPPADWFTRTYRIPASLHRGLRTELVISVDKPRLLPNGDNRLVGMLVFNVGWKPVE